MTIASTATATSRTAQKGRLRRGFLAVTEGIGKALHVLLMTVTIVLGLVLVIGTLSGYSTQTVLTGSMEPTIMTGERIISKDATMADIAVGDIISYRDSVRGISITHRVIELREDGTATVQGDANGAPDSVRIDDSNLLSKVIYIASTSNGSPLKLFTGDARWNSKAIFAAIDGDWETLDQIKADAPWGLIGIALVALFLSVLSFVNKMVRSSLRKLPEASE